MRKVNSFRIRSGNFSKFLVFKYIHFQVGEMCLKWHTEVFSVNTAASHSGIFVSVSLGWQQLMCVYGVCAYKTADLLQIET